MVGDVESFLKEFINDAWNPEKAKKILQTNDQMWNWDWGGAEFHE